MKLPLIGKTGTTVVRSVALILIWTYPLFAQSSLPDPRGYLEAARYYESGDYATALQYFQQGMAENPTYAERLPQLKFKIAYAYFKTGRYAEAIATFPEKAGKLPQLWDYRDYFIHLSYLALGDTAQVLKGLANFRYKHPKSALQAQVDSLAAELYFWSADYDSAAYYYKRLLKLRGVFKGDVYARLVEIGRRAQNRKLLEKYALELIRSYPFHAEAKSAYADLERLYREKKIPEKTLRQFFSYLAQTRQFDKIDQLLDRQEQRGGKTELTRWLRIRKLYKEKRYWAAFQACQSQRRSFKKYKYLREIDLHIARCYLRLGDNEKAIKADVKFQQRYPTDYLAPEVLWVVAWLYEDLGRIDKAQQYYKKLILRYPRCEFVSEARFRRGLAFYRMGDYTLARKWWKFGLAREKDDTFQARYQYWIAKSYAKESQYPQQLAELEQLAGKPFDSYYNLKAFLLTTNGPDIHQFVDSLLWEVHHKQISYLPKYLDYFQKPLLVQELFGEHYAQRELDNFSASMPDQNWEMLYALGEVNERMQNFGRAYRIYRKVYTENFLEKDWREWVFLFKQLYPLYFNGEVNEYARKWNITPASIWAVIKKESAFEPHIISYANAYGLMQIIPPTAVRLAENLGMDLEDVRRLYEPKFNILLGSFYLSELLKRYEGNLYYALAAYNAGEHRVDRWRRENSTEDDDLFMENIEFEQTRAYVRGVMKFYWTYHILIHPFKIPDDLVPFPEKVAREPWFHQVQELE